MKKSDAARKLYYLVRNAQSHSSDPLKNMLVLLDDIEIELGMERPVNHDWVDEDVEKNDPNHNGFLGSPRAAELLFGPSVRRFKRSIEQMLEKGEEEDKDESGS